MTKRPFPVPPLRLRCFPPQAIPEPFRSECLDRMLTMPLSRSLLLLCLTSLLLSQERPRTVTSGAPDPDDAIRAVVILSRHGVRAPLGSETRGSLYNAQPWPAWPVETGVLTEHGGAALRLLAAYYRARYADIFPNGTCDPRTIYAEANNAQRTVASAKSFLEGLGADCQTEVHSQPAGRANPLFSSAEVNGQANREKLANQIQGAWGPASTGGRKHLWNPLKSCGMCCSIATVQIATSRRRACCPHPPPLQPRAPGDS